MYSERGRYGIGERDTLRSVQSRIVDIAIYYSASEVKLTNRRENFKISENF